MKTVILEPLGNHLNVLLESSTLDWMGYQEVAKSKQELIERIGDAEIVAGWSIKIDKEVFEACPQLKYIAVAAVAAVGAGSAVDINEARKRNVTVMNCPGYNAESVSEFAVMLAVLARKRVAPVMNALQDGLWQVHKYRQDIQANVSGARVVIIGYGNIGRRIGELMEPWGVTLTIINSKSGPDKIDDACKIADIIFVCCSLNDQTKGLIDQRRLELIGPKGTIVNVSRGAIVDEIALYNALKNREVGSAGLDVFVDEPFDDGPVKTSIKRFTELQNVVCTPHIAGMSTTSSENLGKILFENIQSCIEDSPHNIYSE